jgi:DNA polymerase III alpha subunit
MSADIDLDFANREAVLKLIQHTPARQTVQGQTRRHNSGVYVTDIPLDPVNHCATIDYEAAEQLGYFKIDFLNMSVYQLITSAEHYARAVATEPTWARLWQEPEWAQQLAHVGNYTDLLNAMRPDTIPRMAAFISIIRPGKAHLQRQTWDQVFASVWDGDESRGYTFKKSHAISYAALVALHMNLLTPSGAPE